MDRVYHWEFEGLNAAIQLSWNEVQKFSGVEIICYTNLQTQIELHPNEEFRKSQIPGVPPEMIKSLSVESLNEGSWKEIARMDNNLHRLFRVSFPSISTNSIRINLKETYGQPTVKLFEVRCY